MAGEDRDLCKKGLLYDPEGNMSDWQSKLRPTVVDIQIQAVLSGESDGCVVCGDCLDVLPELPDKCVDLVCTDPPYGIYACGGKWGHKNALQWDRQPATHIAQWIEKGKDAIVWGGNYFALPPSRCWLVWYKRDSVPSASDVELAWTSLDGNARLIDQTIAATNAERCGHPTQKPLRVMLWSLSFFPAAELIIDPFCGSGTTCVAAKMLGRRYIGIEISSDYVAIARERLAAVDTGVPVKEARAGQMALFGATP